jgi:hypothetical protein
MERMDKIGRWRRRKGGEGGRRRWRRGGGEHFGDIWWRVDLRAVGRRREEG